MGQPIDRPSDRLLGHRRQSFNDRPSVRPSSRSMHPSFLLYPAVDRRLQQSSCVAHGTLVVHHASSTSPVVHHPTVPRPSSRSCVGPSSSSPADITGRRRARLRLVEPHPRQGDLPRDLLEQLPQLLATEHAPSPNHGHCSPMQANRGGAPPLPRPLLPVPATPPAAIPWPVPNMHGTPVQHGLCSGATQGLP